MKYVTYIVKIFLALLITYLITRWWLATWWSERYWTWLNSTFVRLDHNYPGGNLGLASDVELVTVLIFSLLISIGVVMLLFRTIQYIKKHKR